jgi:hypothetical protein
MCFQDGWRRTELAAVNHLHDFFHKNDQLKLAGHEIYIRRADSEDMTDASSPRFIVKAEGLPEHPCTDLDEAIQVARELGSEQEILPF